jgi:prepilin-type N-terminal cleavage/methylation domain-containing protein
MKQQIKGYTLIEVMIVVALLSGFVYIVYNFYTKMMMGTSYDQSNLLDLTSRARLVGRIINWELTNAHDLVAPTDDNTILRTATSLIYYDSEEHLSLLKLKGRNLVKKDFTTGVEKTLVKNVDEVYFTRLDRNLVQFRIRVLSADAIRRDRRNKEFQIIGSVFVSYAK